MRCNDMSSFGVPHKDAIAAQAKEMERVAEPVEGIGGVPFFGDDDDLLAGVDGRAGHEGGDVMGDGLLLVGDLPFFVVVDAATVVLALHWH